VTDADTTRTPAPPPSGTSAGDGAPASAGDSAAPRPDTTGSPPPPPQGPPPQAPPPSAWRPPASDSGRSASLIFGAIILIIGVWFFATNTLGLDLPDLDWGQLWPVILIAIGAWIVLTAMRQRAR
jgi:hypothetical protein